MRSDSDNNSGSRNSQLLFQIDAGTTKGLVGYDQDNNVMQLSYGGNNKHLVVDSAGKVGIGTASPDSKLHVSQTGTAGAFDNITLFRGGPDSNYSGSEVFIGQAGNSRGLLIQGGRGTGDQALAHFYLNRSGGTIPSATQDHIMTFLQGGNVGIGTDDPDAGLHVLNSTEPTVLFESTNAGSSGSRLQLYHNSATPADNDIICNIQIKSNDSGGTKRTAANIQALAADVNASSVDGDIRFVTYKSDTATEVMRITHDKTVGIGTAVSMSTYKLHVYETIDTGVGILAQNPNTGTAATTSVSLLNNSGSLAGFILPSSNYSAVSSWSNRLVINTDSGISNGIIVRPSAGGFTVSTTGLSNPDLYVENGTGHVGIGTNDPSYDLDIGGATSSTGHTLRIHQANGGTAIRVGPGGGGNDITLLRVDGTSSNNSGTTDSSNVGFSLKYMGSRDGNLNALSIFTDNNAAASQIEAVTVIQDGNVGMGTTIPTGKLQIGGSYTIDSGLGGNDIYIKGTTGRTSYDPNIYNTDVFGALITISDSNTVGPTKPGLVLYNDDVTAGGFSPMLLFCKRESGNSPFTVSYTHLTLPTNREV